MQLQMEISVPTGLVYTIKNPMVANKVDILIQPPPRARISLLILKSWGPPVLTGKVMKSGKANKLKGKIAV